MNSPSGITRLVGQPLSGVAFVQDYVELHFDGKILRSFMPMSVISGGVTRATPESGARDSLCALIGKKILDVVLQESKKIDLRFDGGSIVSIPLNEADRMNPEAAHFVPGENLPIEVW